MTFAQELINFPRNDSGGPFVKVSGVDPTTRYSGKSGNSQLVASVIFDTGLFNPHGPFWSRAGPHSTAGKPTFRAETE